MGDILVFLTGQDDIDAAVRLLTEEAQNNRKSSSGTFLIEDYPGLSAYCVMLGAYLKILFQVFKGENRVVH